MFDKYISLNFFPTTPFSIDVFTGGQQLILKLNDFIVVFKSEPRFVLQS